MSVELGNLKPGQWRDLTPAEMNDINQAVAGSTKTADEGVINQKGTKQVIHVRQQAQNTSKKKLSLNKRST
jgi:23S rRNA pseudouridine2604 synthase